MFTYAIENQGAKTVVLFEGDLDIDGTELIEGEITPKLLKSPEIEIDFSNVLFVDSSGIGLLITLIRNLQDAGNLVRVVHLTSDVKQIFALLQLPEIVGTDVLSDFQCGNVR